MAKVILKKASYDYEALKEQVCEVMNSLGGKEIMPRSSVVIKPNLLAPAPPDKAMLTHPLVVKATVEYVLQRGACPRISDSPAMGSFEKVLKESGIKDALGGLDVECREFKESESVNIGEPFNFIEISRDALRADVVINLPKLKTHSQMLLTLGVKNLFGCIVGLRKPEWHFRTGVDREMFAKLLVGICRVLKPSFTILDGIVALEGQGPGKGGTPRSLGVLMGSEDAFALDIVVCRMLGIEPERLLTNRVALEAGLVESALRVEGDLPGVSDFKLPEIAPLVFGPKAFHGAMRRHFLQRPASHDTLCRLCGECWKYCPAKAITHDTKRVRFDYEKCIRCYCCIEVCPHGALSAEETIPGKVIRRIMKISS
jgi:uncharacterized protein (DUF362 family)/NAD-dependent dihydropyrimidine dehydrogenase PreA subunit